MKKIFICTVLIIGMATIQAQAFDWASTLNFLGRASEAQLSQTQPATLNDLEKQMNTIDNSVQTAFVDVVSLLSGWRETRTIKSQLKSNEDILANIISNYTNTYIETNRQTIVNKIKKMSAKEKAQLINSLNTIAENGQNYFLLAANGAKIAANSFKTAQTVNEAAVTIANINRTAAEIKNRSTTAMMLVNQIKSIATAAGVNVN